MIPATSGVSYINLGSLFTWDGLLYFFPNSNVLQRYDGTSASPETVRQLNTPFPAPTGPVTFQGFGVANDTLWLGANDGVIGVELWKSDGTPAGTGLLKEINPNTDLNKGSTGSSPFGFTGLGGYVYFAA